MNAKIAMGTESDYIRVELTSDEAADWPENKQAIRDAAATVDTTGKDVSHVAVMCGARLIAKL